MNILDEIIADKRKEIALKQQLYPVKLLEQSRFFETQPVSLKAYIRKPGKSGIIAEIKRRSPSKGVINKYVSVEQVSVGYMQAGASALSVLTDGPYFGGSDKDLETARRFNYCPVLRKEFIVDAYQVIESKAMGADAILLIASVLSKAQIAAFTALAHQLGLEVLLEVHNRAELSHIPDDLDVIGVNNRDLASFVTNVDRSYDLLPYLPEDIVKISESGIDEPAVAAALHEAGYDGFLIGGHFMRHSRPQEACATFIKQYNTIRHGH